MADLRREGLRAVVVLAVLVVGLVEVRAQIQAVRSHRRLRARVAGEVRARVEAARPRFAPLVTAGPASWDEAIAFCLGTGIASEGEVLEAETGRSLLSRPTIMPVAHSFAQVQEALRAGDVATVIVQTGPELRALTYVPFLAAGQRYILRLATPAPDIQADLRERQQLFVAHLLAVSVLLLAAGLALLPRPGAAPAAAAPQALDAYEQAMGRLRDQGEARTRAHEAERRRMEEEIEDKQAMARAGELTAGIVHEVRNGLGTILGYARLVERDPASPDLVLAGRHIREECETLEGVIRRFMDFVKRESLALDSFDLVRMLTRVAARESRSGAGAEVKLDHLPDALAVVGDEELLERAFENLIRNGREAAGAQGRVLVRVSAAEERVSVSVADDGPGLPPGRRRELRPFFTTKAGGLGLGLPIAYKIIRLHEGELELLDVKPRGLEVRVSLPAKGPPN